MTILQTGMIEDEQALESLLQQNTKVVMPNSEDEDADQFWVVVHQGEQILYLGNERTFAVWVKEEEGVQ